MNKETNKVKLHRIDSEQKAGFENSILLYLHDLVSLLAAILLVLLLVFRIVIVSGPSMNNTLIDGDYLLLLSSNIYPEPKYGDIIVASKDNFKNGEPIIKRVIATEGQEVEIDFELGIVYVDNEPLNEDYVLTPTNLAEGISFPLVVDEGCLFVMGDNRNASKDSRNPEIGLIDKREVLGKAFFLLLPGTNGGSVQPHYNRIGVLK